MLGPGGSISAWYSPSASQCCLPFWFDLGGVIEGGSVIVSPVRCTLRENYILFGIHHPQSRIDNLHCNSDPIIPMFGVGVIRFGCAALVRCIRSALLILVGAFPIQSICLGIFNPESGLMQDERPFQHSVPEARCGRVQARMVSAAWRLKPFEPALTSIGLPRKLDTTWLLIASVATIACGCVAYARGVRPITRQSTPGIRLTISRHSSSRVSTQRSSRSRSAYWIASAESSTARCNAR